MVVFVHFLTVDLEREDYKMSDFTHFDEKGNARMVNVSEKEITHRVAIAEGDIYMSSECLQMIKEGKHKKAMF